MEIKYKKINNFKEKELQDIFLSVKWDSGNYPDKLKKAIKNSHMVYQHGSLMKMGVMKHCWD